MEKESLLKQIQLDIDVLKLITQRMRAGSDTPIDLELLNKKTIEVYEQINILTVILSAQENEEPEPEKNSNHFEKERKQAEDEKKVIEKMKMAIESANKSLEDEKGALLEEKKALEEEKDYFEVEKKNLKNVIKTIEDEKLVLEKMKKKLEEEKISIVASKTANVPEPVIPDEEIYKEVPAVKVSEAIHLNTEKKSQEPDKNISVHKSIAPKDEKTALHEKFSKNEMTINDMQAGRQDKSGLADKMQKVKITDLKAAISLHQRIVYIRELFKGDEKEYRKFIDFINRCENYSEAKYFIQSEMEKHDDWVDHANILEGLMDLINRKFL